MVGLSVIIPFYNSEDSLSSVVERIALVLSEIRYEIIIVNDGSAQHRVGEVLTRLQDRFSFLIVFNQPNLGVSAARNKGVTLAKYDLIAFCDSDDLWTRDKWEVQKTFLTRDNFKFIGAEKRYLMTSDVVRIDKLWELLSWGPHLSSVIMKKELFLKIGGFDESFTRLEDGEFYLRLIDEIGPIDCVNVNLHYNWKMKASYGVEGLSADLFKMFKSEVMAIKSAGGIMGYCVLPLLFLKYLRRVAISSLRQRE